ncbi:MAG: hypothetical protein NC433_14380 [Clostridiales bacterium]|nr:hypothetical protein [Clostridiales bacterium]
MSKERKIITKKDSDRMFNILIVFTVIFIAVSLVYIFVDMGTSGQIAYIIFGVFFLLCVSIEAVFQLKYWSQGVSAHVTNYQGAKCFEEIDSYIRNLGECNTYYRGVIFELNKIYKTSPELKQLINTQDFETLYTRKTYLENNLDFYNNTIQLVAALGISLVVIFAQVGLSNETNFAYGYFIIALILFLLCVTIKYFTKGRGDSYIYNLHEYELKLLKEKIDSANKQLQANSDIEKILLLYHAINNILINIYNNRKELRRLKLSKKEVNEIYKTLHELPLLQELDGADIIWAKIGSNEPKYYFPIIIDAGQYKFLNKNYEKMYKILQRLHIIASPAIKNPSAKEGKEKLF